MKTAVAMKVCDILGVGGSYSEIAAVDYQRGTIMLGHDGPFHLAIAGQKPILRGMGLYHGKWGSGVSVEATVRTGPVTVLNMTQDAAGRLRAIVNEGEGNSCSGPARRQHAHARSFRPAAHALHGRLVRDGAHAPRRLERRTQRRGVPQGRYVDGLALPERHPVTVCQAQRQPLPANGPARQPSRRPKASRGCLGGDRQGLSAHVRIPCQKLAWPQTRQEPV